MAVINIQIKATEELNSMVNTAREIIRKENNLEDKNIITNGYVLNSAIRYLNALDISFSDNQYWEKINTENIQNLLKDTEIIKTSTMKFRLASLSEDKINELLVMYSDIFGTKIFKNYVVKMILRAFLIEKNNSR